MDLLQFTNPELFKSISLDQETLILESKDSKYTFHINCKDEIKGVDFYEIDIATQTSSGYINKSGTVGIIQSFILDILNNKNTNLNDEAPKVENKKATPKNKVTAKSNSGSNRFYQNIKK